MSAKNPACDATCPNYCEHGQLKLLLEAVDTAVWAWNRKSDKRVDWKGAIQELSETYRMFRQTIEQTTDKTASGGE